MKVKAKFRCAHITQYERNKNVHFSPVLTGSEENKSFAKYTPGGKLEMMIDHDTPAAEAFKVGTEYTITLEESEVQSNLN